MVAVAAAGWSAPARADQFTPAQRAEIVSIVRNALKTDPTILGDAITALRADAARKEDAANADALRDNPAALSPQPGDIVRGDGDARTTLVEFYDPRCPYCRKVLPDLDALLAGRRDLKLVEKIIPILGPDSTVDARAIQAAIRQNKGLEMQQALMTDHGKGLDHVREAAAKLGLDWTRLQSDMGSAAVKQELERNIALAHAINLTGTPTFIAGRQVLPGAASLAELRALVDQATPPTAR
ncbi:DsbA family protein [Rhizosaccharibacter radicis]|uniref:DsbA family protein n=1 Tax=Rhizosaccharibacter radicis TaxID=2782605 RepID=A0ABT1W2R4_9PROT|nr:DsbA family protein [Acetobacteraceae bacterium KSS12]